MHCKDTRLLPGLNWDIERSPIIDRITNTRVVRGSNIRNMRKMPRLSRQDGSWLDSDDHGRIST